MSRRGGINGTIGQTTFFVARPIVFLYNQGPHLGLWHTEQTALTLTPVCDTQNETALISKQDGNILKYE